MKIIFRILLSPFIFLWGVFLLLCGSLFPLPLIVILSFISLMLEPFIYLFNKTGSNVKSTEALFTVSKYNWINHFLGATIYFWGVFYIVYLYIKTGEIFTGD